MAVLGEVPGQGVVYRQGGYVSGESTCIRERAREMGLSMNQLAEKAGVSKGYMSDVSRGRRNMGVKVQQRVEALLQAPAQAAPAQKPRIDCRALWERMDAHGISQNEAARRAGISVGHLSLVMSGKRTPSGDVLRRLHDVLFAPSPAERVMPVELKVLAWKKGKRNGVVIRGAGGPRSDGRPGDGTIRVGGRAPWGARGGVRLHHRIRQPGPGLGEPPGGRAGLLRPAGEAGDGAGIRPSSSRHTPRPTGVGAPAATLRSRLGFHNRPCGKGTGCCTSGPPGPCLRPLPLSTNRPAM